VLDKLNKRAYAPLVSNLLTVIAMGMSDEGATGWTTFESPHLICGVFFQQGNTGKSRANKTRPTFAGVIRTTNLRHIHNHAFLLPSTAQR
jgi:hypothetical protein